MQSNNDIRKQFDEFMRNDEPDEPSEICIELIKFLPEHIAYLKQFTRRECPIVHYHAWKILILGTDEYLGKGQQGILYKSMLVIKGDENA